MKKILFLTLLLIAPFALQSGTKGDILLSIKDKKVQLFFTRIWQDAEYVSREYKIPMALVLAQAAQESGFGTSKNAIENCNFFGVRRCGKYEVYSCRFESFVDYGSQVLGAECYNGCTSLNDWFTALECCKYAGDKKYIKRLKKIIERYKLYLI